MVELHLVELRYGKLCILSASKVKEAASIEETSHALAVSALIIKNLSHKRTQGFAFSWEYMLSFNGCSGPALQYQHARLSSLLRHMREKAGIEPSVDVDLSSLVDDPVALDVVINLARFDEAILKTCSSLDPYHIAQYVHSLA